MCLIKSLLLVLRQELNLVREVFSDFYLLLFLLVQKIAQVRAEPLNVHI
jgi:hypothetical protein